MNRLLVVTILAVTVALHAGGQALQPQTAGNPKRVMAAGEWQVVRTIGLDTDLFEEPIALAATGERFVVVDGHVLHSFRVTGQREWSFGRKGAGPGEFEQILSVAIDGAGNTLIYDGGLLRLTEVGPAGKLGRVVPLPSRIDRAAFSDGGRYLLLRTMGDTLSQLADSLGRIGEMHLLPPELRKAEGTSREMSSVVPVSKGYLVTFRWSSRMHLVSRAGVVSATCTGVDSLSFPDVVRQKMELKMPGVSSFMAIRVDPRARQAVYRATMLGGRLLIEPSNRSAGTHVFDVYETDCGRYLESRRFPFRNTQVAGAGDLLVAVLNEPVPHVVVLRWIRSSSAPKP